MSNGLRLIIIATLNVFTVAQAPCADPLPPQPAVEIKPEIKPAFRLKPVDTSPQDSSTGEKVSKIPRRLFKGKVVRVVEALKRKGIKVYSEELERQVALETATGTLIPLLPDWRGRAFFQDEQLRDRPVELIGHRRDGIPYLSVLSVYTFDENEQRQYTDYWCDVCSIPMYEIKPCDCCQQDIRIRFQPQELPPDLDTTEQTKAAK